MKHTVYKEQIILRSEELLLLFILYLKERLQKSLFYCTFYNQKNETFFLKCVFFLNSRLWILFWVELCSPPIRMLGALTPRTSEWDLIWRWGCCRCNGLRRGHTGVEWPSANDWVIRGEIWTGPRGEAT